MWFRTAFLLWCTRYMVYTLHGVHIAWCSGSAVIGQGIEEGEVHLDGMKKKRKGRSKDGMTLFKTMARRFMTVIKAVPSEKLQYK